MATLQAALKRGIEMTFQIEESELVAEPLPKQDDRKALLFYEAAEGGAGVLTRLATEPGAMAQVAAQALRLMHHDDAQRPLDGRRPARAGAQDATTASSICEAGCYQCLLSYFNQPDHDHINRRNAAGPGDARRVGQCQRGAAHELRAQPPNQRADRPMATPMAIC
ncbi:MAG: DUF1998 domain-containing protein [Giesbergeria sp.]